MTRAANRGQSVFDAWTVVEPVRAKGCFESPTIGSVRSRAFFAAFAPFGTNPPATCQQSQSAAFYGVPAVLVCCILRYVSSLSLLHLLLVHIENACHVRARKRLPRESEVRQIDTTGIG